MGHQYSNTVDSCSAFSLDLVSIANVPCKELYCICTDSEHVIKLRIVINTGHSSDLVDSNIYYQVLNGLILINDHKIDLVDPIPINNNIIYIGRKSIISMIVNNRLPRIIGYNENKILDGCVNIYIAGIITLMCWVNTGAYSSGSNYTTVFLERDKMIYIASMAKILNILYECIQNEETGQLLLKMPATISYITRDMNNMETQYTIYNWVEMKESKTDCFVGRCFIEQQVLSVNLLQISDNLE